MVGHGECPGRIKKGAADASGDLRGLRVSAPRDLHQMRLYSKGQDVVECGKVPDWEMVTNSTLRLTGSFVAFIRPRVRLD